MAGGLRRCAEGSPTDEAAVEVLTSCFPARYTQHDCPWIRRCQWPGWYWLDPDALAALELTSARQRHVLTVVVTLLGGQPTDTLSTDVSGLRRATA